MLHYTIGTYHKHLRMNMEDGLVEELCMVPKLNVSSCVTVLSYVEIVQNTSVMKLRNGIYCD